MATIATLRRRRSTPLIPYVPTFFEEDLLDWLSSTLNLVCYPGHIPQGVTTFPALTLSLISGDREYLLDGSRVFTESHYQISIWSTNYFEVGSTSLALEDGLLGFRGYLGKNYVKTVLLENEHTDYEPAIDGSDFGTHCKHCEYVFYYN